MELTHLLAPIMGTSFYLGFPRELLYNTDPDYIRSVSIFHNTVLCLFSVWTFCSLFSGLIKYGIVVEPAFYMSKPEINNVVYWFYLSKYYEYVDTFIIYAKNKHPIFLQTFHHTGAAIVWHLGYTYSFDGTYFASVFNSFVHSWMYLYYLLAIFRVPSIQPYKVYLTTMQIAQLVSGSILMHTMYYPIETPERQVVLFINQAYILYLIYLFSEFMFKTYFVEKRKDSNVLLSK